MKYFFKTHRSFFVTATIVLIVLSFFLSLLPRYWISGYWCLNVSLVLAPVLLFSVFKFIKNILCAFAAFLCLLVSFGSVYVLKDLLGIEVNVQDFLGSLSISAALFSSFVLFFFWCCELNRTLGGVLKFTAILALGLCLLLPCMVWSYYLAEGSLLSSDLIMAFAQTNIDESSEYFLSHVKLSWAAALLVTVAVITLNIVLFLKVKPVSYGFKSTHFLAAALCVFMDAALIPGIEYFATSTLRVTGEQLAQFKIFGEQKEIRLLRLSQLGTLKIMEKAADNEQGGGIFALVIGESETSDNMSAYGYGLKTTPYLDLLKSDPNTVMFTNAYSNYPQTVPALTMALTQNNQYEQIDLTNVFSIVEIARAAGFETYWISNQRKFGVYETPITVVSSTAEHEIWLNGSSKMQGVYFDGELLNRLPKLDGKKNALLIFHLMGCHQQYGKRYPRSFRKFNQTRTAEDEYNNAILYNDYVLENLFLKLKQYPNFMCMVYFSDHGEDLKIFDHNPDSFTFQMVRIPLIARVTPQFKKNRPKAFNALSLNKKKFWSNDLVFDLIANVMGIKGVPNYNPKLDISSKAYNLDSSKVKTMHGNVSVSLDSKLHGR